MEDDGLGIREREKGNVPRKNVRRGTRRSVGTVQQQGNNNCLFCDKHYATSAQLEEHMNSHTQERPHQCLHCDANFTSEKTMHVHTSSLHVERKHTCNICQKTFGAASNRAAHKRKYHPDLQTNLCVADKDTFDTTTATPTEESDESPDPPMSPSEVAILRDSYEVIPLRQCSVVITKLSGVPTKLKEEVREETNGLMGEKGETNELMEEMKEETNELMEEMKEETNELMEVKEETNELNEDDNRETSRCGWLDTEEFNQKPSEEYFHKDDVNTKECPGLFQEPVQDELNERSDGGDESNSRGTNHVTSSSSLHPMNTSITSATSASPDFDGLADASEESEQISSSESVDSSAKDDCPFEKRKLPCLFCTQWFSKERKLRNHVSSSHGISAMFFLKRWMHTGKEDYNNNDSHKKATTSSPEPTINAKMVPNETN